MVAISTRQQKSGNQREGGEQGLRGRTMGASYPDRYTGDTQRRILPEASEASTQGPELQEQKKGLYRQDFNAPTRCTSPVPFKTQSTPQLNLQIPKKYSRNPATATAITTGHMKILKRHTSPYPTPASSPNVDALSPSMSTPARSNTHPVGKDLENLEEKYTNRMKSLLESNLKVFGPSKSQSKELLKEVGLEANPVPDFFVDPIYSEATTSFISPTFKDSPDENVMMDSKYITICSVQDLDNEMRDFLPDTYSEFMPGPEEPMQEPKSNVVVTVDSPTEAQQNLSHPMAATNGFLSTPMRGHPMSDSGIGSMIDSPGRHLTEPRSSVQAAVAVKKDYLGHSRKISATSSLETEAGLGNGSLVGCPNLISDDISSYVAQHWQEPTPPSSADLSPGSFHATQSELSNTMAPQSIQAIETHILGPMSKNLDLFEFQTICTVAKDKVYEGRIRCLRDLEKYFVNMGNTMGPSLYSMAFFDAFLSGIQNAWPSVLESDRVRQTDIPYSDGYFLDIRHQHGIEIGKQSEVHQKQKSKRKLSICADTLPPAAKRPMTSTTTFDVQHGPFVKPVTQPRQNAPSKKHLEIQTQTPFNNCITTQLCGHSQQSTILNSTFTFDENTKTLIAKGQFHNTQTYRDITSQMWQPTAPQFVLPATVLDHHGGFWPPQTPVSTTSATAPPVDFTMPPTTPTSAVSITNPSRFSTSTPRVNAKDDATIHSCEICHKAFPRPCDLTKHRKTHERPFKCDFTSCKYHAEGFPTNKERERHQNDIHASDSKEWKCQFAPCPYKSKRESNCKQHMEKAHRYVYKRMKRNPRRRDQGAAPTQESKRRKNTSAVSQPQPSTLLRNSPLRLSENIQVAQASHHILPQTYFPQQPPSTPELLDPSQIEAITRSVFPGSLNPHIGQPYYESSPITNTDFERTPLTIISNGFDDHDTLCIDPNASPMLTDHNWFPGESEGPLCSNQFFSSNSNFCMPQPQQETPADFHRVSEFEQHIQWISKSDTPD